MANRDSLGNIFTKEQIEYFKDTKATNATVSGIGIFKIRYNTIIDYE